MSIPTTLVLRHNDISTTTTTQTVDATTGGWSNYKQTTYWNVNLKTLLGSEWDKYEIFCIRLVQASFASVNYPTSSTTDVSWLSYMSGLNWYNSSFNQATNSNQSRAFMGAFVVAASTNAVQSFNNNSITNFFRKGDNYVRIQIEHFRLTDGAIVGSTTGLPQTAWHFEIFGVE